MANSYLSYYTYAKKKCMAFVWYTLPVESGPPRTRQTRATIRSPVQIVFFFLNVVDSQAPDSERLHRAHEHLVLFFLLALALAL